MLINFCKVIAIMNFFQKMEAQLKTCEGQLRDLRQRGEELSVVAPKMINPTEIKALQTSYMELQQKVTFYSFDVPASF